VYHAEVVSSGDLKIPVNNRKFSSRQILVGNPFGSELTGRTYKNPNVGAYRYGFNGKEDNLNNENISK
jgi:hypothetical protein